VLQDVKRRLLELVPLLLLFQLEYLDATSVSAARWLYTECMAGIGCKLRAIATHSCHHKLVKVATKNRPLKAVGRLRPI